MAYDPDLSQLSEILKAYARQGAREYNNLESNIRRRIGIKFAQRVVADEKQIDDWFLDFSAGKASKPSIFPTPKPEAQIDAAFFYPRWEKGKFRLELLLWFDKEEINGKTMAFRLEPGHAKGNVHNYSHVQISRHVRAPINFTTSIPVWIPVSFRVS